MTSKEIIKEILKKWNFLIIREEENSIITRYQMSYINVCFPDYDFPYIALVLSGVFRVESSAQHRKAIELCNVLNDRVSPTKSFVDEQGVVSFSSGFLYHTEADVEIFFEKALREIIQTKASFSRCLEPMLIDAAERSIDLN